MGGPLQVPVTTPLPLLGCCGALVIALALTRYLHLAHTLGEGPCIKLTSVTQLECAICFLLGPCLYKYQRKSSSSLIRVRTGKARQWRIPSHLPLPFLYKSYP